MKKLLSVAMLAALSFAAQADEGWSGTGEFGLVLSRGNADTDTLNAKLVLKHEDETWLHEVGVSALRAEANDVRTADRFELGGKSGYKFNERHYLAGVARYENDDFSPYENQWTVAVTYGVHAINSDATKLTFEIGPGYRRFDPAPFVFSETPPIIIDEGSDSEFMLRGFADFNHKFNDSTSIYNTFLVESGSDNTFMQDDIGVLVKMSEALALKAGFQVRHNNDVPPDADKTDTLTTINVVYGF